jgi:hypothetical protein
MGLRLGAHQGAAVTQAVDIAGVSIDSAGGNWVGFAENHNDKKSEDAGFTKHGGRGPEAKSERGFQRARGDIVSPYIAGSCAFGWKWGGRQDQGVAVSVRKIRG